MPAGTTLSWPHKPGTEECQSIDFAYKMVPVTMVDGKGADPNTFPRSFRYTNVISGDEETFFGGGLDLAPDTVFEEGKFYEDPHTGFKYKCESLSGGETATMFMVESYQHGEALAARMKFHAKYSSKYLEIADQEEIDRLEWLYQEILKS